MQIIHSIAHLRGRLTELRESGGAIAMVPTMGNLHAGHLRLVEAARQRARSVVASIFVNPLQFGPGEDFERYPRTLEEDAGKLAESGLDLLFAPPVDVMYPGQRENTAFVEVPGISDRLCGAFRPGHFRGVTTVVAKLFNLVQPDLAVFGEKDYQQLLVIRKMVADLNFPVEILGVPIVREVDGLAMSSRNCYLSPGERARATRLYEELCAARRAILEGERDFSALAERAMSRLREAGFEPDYFEIRSSSDLSPPVPDRRPLRILTAARLGRTRLIDNLEVA
ncbi:MAG: pantoate--beta-alanine ligase [Methylohalobius sp. ZOD2]